MNFVRPGGDKEALADILDRADLRKDVIVCSARDREPFLARPLNQTVPKLWDLEPVENEYRRFIAGFQKLSAFLNDAEGLDPELSFVVRTILIHAFRRVVLHDPLLPAELLPRHWEGADAYALCRSIYQVSSDGAEQHLATVLDREGTQVSEAADYFYERFGGIERPSRSKTDCP